MTDAFINRIATALPPHDVHGGFIDFARRMLKGDNRRLTLFNRMAERSGISHRYSIFEPEGEGDAAHFYRPGAFPGTGARMKLFENFAPRLATEAAERLLTGEDRSRITHLIVTCCTGFFAPGIDLQLVARHIVRSEPGARVLAMNLELCTLHLHETTDLEEILSFLLFGDGCAAALISADPVGGRMDSFKAALMPDTAELIRWNIREQGFDMVLSGGVPGAIRSGLSQARATFLNKEAPIDLWAVHPGGRTVLDAVEASLELPPTALAVSRGVLSDFGNMSSATVMFVLDRMMRDAAPGRSGCAMAFGPGLVAETMRFCMAA